MQTIRIDLGACAYDVVVGAGALASLAELVASLGPIPRALVVTDDNVAPRYLEPVVASLAGLCSRVDACVLPAGEQHKTLDSLQRVWRAALDVDADRRLLIVALGGGVIGDLAGFAAATILRGVRVVQLPTTLLAQVDASVGGKTAINVAQGKNLVGAFKQPALVVADTSTFSTLEQRELRSGMAEVIKHAAILDAPLLGVVDGWADRGGDILDPALVDIVARCVRLKAGVVIADEREGGVRKILNFGHTIGHALEKLAGYGVLTHGEAVAIGMLAAARLGERRGISAAGLAVRLRTTLAAVGLPTTYPDGIAPAAIAAEVAHDKKLAADRVDFVLCPSLGRAQVTPIGLAELSAFIAEDLAADHTDA